MTGTDGVGRSVTPVTRENALETSTRPIGARRRTTATA
jgi:hypothetical protein